MWIDALVRGKPCFGRAFFKADGTMLKSGDQIKAVVFATRPFGIFLRHAEHPDVDILVLISEVSWAKDTSPSERAKVGDELLLRIIYVGDKTSARATIVGEEP